MSKLNGKLIVKNDVKTYGDNGFRKREIVIETEDKYPQKVLIELIQDNVDLINDYNLGDYVSISYNVNGREWINPEGEAKYFNSITGWRIEKFDVDTQNTPSQPQPVSEQVDTDLPF